ncbi:MAG: hypothetical protein A2Z21_04360 [Candidatus Fraserbacteria bacterium RBG_16_55_9]|uniref:Saccharopine dehydrogenase n=1 Tax=Fraserbacteria sp. (strain RBG_16_55_9) TaxID=1817864 RepID=A0A1F5UNZ1_FRAXR|nr:MAG: hypothetical protein A2Z21_04360 [Candidatus Fraserbacteria bacterium RBG_16_55_9]
MRFASTHRFVVLGVGAMGSVAVKDLASSPHVRQVTIADLDERRVREFARKLGKKNVVARFADVDDPKGLVKLLRGHDAVINCTPYAKNVPVMEAALEAGVHYLDLGGLYHETRRQLKLHADYKRAELLAVLGMGVSPGITNVMARYAAEHVDRVEEIKIRVASVLAGETVNPLAIPYSLATILDEFTKSPVVFTKGKLQEIEPLSGQQMIIFPEPVGAVEAVYTLHSELATLPTSYKSKGIREVSFKVAFPAAFFERLRLLIDLGFAEASPVDVKGIPIVPRDVLSQLTSQLSRDEKPPASYGVLRVEASGKKKGQRTRYTLDLFRSPRPEYPGVSPTAITTGLPPSIVAQMIVSGKMTVRGVLPPETCVEPELFFRELALRGLRITVRAEHLV